MIKLFSLRSVAELDLGEIMSSCFFVLRQQADSRLYPPIASKLTIGLYELRVPTRMACRTKLTKT